MAKRTNIFFGKRKRVKPQTSQTSTCTKSTKMYSEFAPGRANTSFDISQEIVLRLAGEVLGKGAKTTQSLYFFQKQVFLFIWKLDCISDSPLKFFFVKIQNQNEIEEFQTHPLFFRTQTKRDVLTNLSKRSPQKSEKLLLTMQKFNQQILREN